MLGFFPLLLLAACSRPEPGPPALADMVAEALPSVVLVVVERRDGSSRFGAGTLVHDGDLVLTNLHVVEGAQLAWVMFHDPTRTSYSPLDGGLSRYLFEQEPRLVPAHLVRGDPNLDLAVIRPQRVPEGLEPLEVRADPVRAGEPVYALGHPKESVWSFTGGVVSALHQGVIQHDAAVNVGNSGGPLVDASGRLVGINTMKLLGDAEGVGFARPVSYATALIEDVAAPVAIDRSTPDRAMLTCEHALEIAPVAASECFDWSSAGRLGDLVVERAADLARLGPAERKRLVAWMKGEGRATWIEDTRAAVMAHLSVTPVEQRARGRSEPPLLFASLAERDAHVAREELLERFRDEIARRERYEAERLDRLSIDNGLLADVTRDAEAYRETRRMGTRVLDVRVHEGRDLAWVRVRGRNVDATPFVYTECWSRAEDGWKQPMLCTELHRDVFPSDWPPTVFDEEAAIARQGLALAMRIVGLDPSALEPEAVETAPSRPGAAVPTSAPVERATTLPGREKTGR